MTPEALAQLFHETYETLAPEFGYKTREASAVPWADVPRTNKRLMVCVAGRVLEKLEKLDAAARAGLAAHETHETAIIVLRVLRSLLAEGALADRYNVDLDVDAPLDSALAAWHTAGCPVPTLEDA